MSPRETHQAAGRLRVLVAGVSTRAAAESAARAGFRVTAIDAFGDLDHHPGVRALSLPRDFGAPVSASAAARASRSIVFDAVAYVSNFDNHPAAVAALVRGRALWGNPPPVLRRVRDPRLLTRALRRRGLAAPEIFAAADVRSAPASPAAAGPDVGGAASHARSGVATTLTPHERTIAERTGPREGRWLVKPLASGGGHRVRRWRRGARVPQGCYLQEFVDGAPASVVFVAAAGRAVPIGVSRQLVGEAAFGAAGFRYCGSILAAAGDPLFACDDVLFDGACALARAVSEDFQLVGVNGVDFIARDNVPWAVEVNPRWSASMELVERAFGLSVFGAHADACVSGTLPGFDLARVRGRAGASGKGVVFARHDIVIGDTRSWLADATVRDVPHPGEAIRAGRPVCTVFAEGADAAACHDALVRRADRVYEQLASWERRTASCGERP
jgi:predicted ATP-grasp superfamily ATP-dependent carboligase